VTLVSILVLDNIERPSYHLLVITSARVVAIRLNSLATSVDDLVTAEALLRPLSSGNAVALCLASSGAALWRESLGIWLLGAQDATIGTINVAALIGPAGREARTGREGRRRASGG
jgi:hypothetical protein